MAISDNLVRAILAMDSYNRGYEPGILGLGGKDTGIGKATVGDDSSVLGAGVAEADSFYAVAYDLNGETIISFRGTDPALPAL